MQSQRDRVGESSQTVENTEPRTQQQQQPSHVLRLRGDEPKRRGGVRWEEGTVDNEHLGKKKSKICCIYHKPKRFDESSDESDCSDSEHHKDCKFNKYDNPSHPKEHKDASHTPSKQ